jgi:formylglycine-generating enzyme
MTIPYYFFQKSKKVILVYFSFLILLSSCSYFIQMSEEEWNNRNKKNKTTSSSILPGNVTGVYIDSGNSQVMLCWTAPADADFVKVEITSTPAITPVTVLKGTNEAIITGLTNGTVYTFTLKSVDTSNNKSSGITVSKTPALFANAATNNSATLTNNITSVAVQGTGITSADPGVSLQGRTVKFSNFWIGKYEVTYLQWTEVRTWALTNGYTNLNAGGGSGTYPVVSIGWCSAMVWCNALSEKEGFTPCYTYNGNVIRNASDTTACDNALLNLSNNGYRLPTLAEREYAGRGGTLNSGFTYPGSNTIGDVVWYSDNSGGAAHPVGTKLPNELGLYDILGNAWEWSYDWYGSISTGTIEINPIGPASPASGTKRVRAGDCFNNPIGEVSYNHINYWTSTTGGISDTGFRLARTL